MNFVRMLNFSNIDRPAWNKGIIIGQKPPLKLKEVWSIRTHLQLGNNHRDLALFNLAIDSKLRACDLVSLFVNDVALNASVHSRAVVRQRKTGRPVQFEITEQTREALSAWITISRRQSGDYLFPSRTDGADHLSTRQYARLVSRWVTLIGLDAKLYGTHSIRRTKASLIYRKTGNIRAVQLLLGHSKLESTVRYLGVEVEDALNIAEQIEV
jgi:integrase